ncbi:type II toxin-antitoxin system Phd/YefM family antitoxin [Synechococcus sp. CS-1327]|nr:type II toxin-antitoxin system Phd/YefM family antitoxin [Synechococcus sp. CS-1327]
MISIRELRNRPGAAQQQLAAQGELLLTNNGQPVALMVSVDGSTLEESLQALRLAKAQLALRQLRRAARGSGAAELGNATIDDEIQALRQQRRQQAPC